MNWQLLARHGVELVLKADSSHSVSLTEMDSSETRKINPEKAPWEGVFPVKLYPHTNSLLKPMTYKNVRIFTTGVLTMLREGVYKPD
ncbi:hypothetical protein, partial [Rhizobium mayense]